MHNAISVPAFFAYIPQICKKRQKFCVMLLTIAG
nr:MAG TPA: hypothetical protein [Caudoviricetes sp.]